MKRYFRNSIFPVLNLYITNCSFLGIPILFLMLLLSPVNGFAQYMPPGGWGSPSSKWDLSVAYSGTADMTPATGFTASEPGNHSVQGISSNSVDLSLCQHPPHTASGAMTVDFGCDLNSSSMVARMKFNAAKMIFTLTYQPSSTADSPPAKIKISFRRRVTLSVTAFAHNSGDSANGSGSGTIAGGGGANCTVADDVTAVGASPITASKFSPSTPEDFSTVELSLDAPTSSNPSPKTFTFKFDIAGSVNGATYGPASNGEASQGNPSPASGGAVLHFTVDFCVDGVDLSRYGPMSGHHERTVQDPSYTRWLPLSFSPKLNSQPFRIQAGALTAPGETSTVSIARN